MKSLLYRLLRFFLGRRIALRICARGLWAENPLLKYPRNEQCFCGSGIKFKRCHLGKIPTIMRAEQILKLNLHGFIKEVEKKR